MLCVYVWCKLRPEGFGMLFCKVKGLCVSFLVLEEACRTVFLDTHSYMPEVFMCQ